MRVTLLWQCDISRKRPIDELRDDGDATDNTSPLLCPAEPTSENDTIFNGDGDGVLVVEVSAMEV